MMFMPHQSSNMELMRPSTLDFPLADISGGRRSEDTGSALIQWGGPRPIDANDGINIFTADKATPRVDRVPPHNSFI
jgi:hypothetical protein